MINTPLPPCKQNDLGWYKGITLSYHMSIFLPSLMDELILMKLYIVAIYNLRICMKEDDLWTPLREIIEHTTEGFF